MAAVSLDFLSVFGLAPVSFVELAAKLGCEHVSLAPVPFPDNPHGYPLYSLRTDTSLRRETIAALRDTGVTVSIGEGIILLPDAGAAAYESDLDLFAELGAPVVNVISMDRDVARTIDEMAKLAEMAAARGLGLAIEMCPLLTIADFPVTLEAIRQIGRPDVGIVVDALHVARSGATAADIAAIDPALIAYFQLCDAPLVPGEVPYAREAAAERLCPGAGELPLADYLAAIPEGVVVGLEIPMISLAEAGVGPEERLRPCVEAARRMLAA